MRGKHPYRDRPDLAGRLYDEAIIRIRALVREMRVDVRGQDRDDLISDAVSHILTTSIAQFDSTAGIALWTFLTTAAKNKVLNLLRARRSNASLDDLDDDALDELAVDDDPAAKMLAEEDREELRLAADAVMLAADAACLTPEQKEAWDRLVARAGGVESALHSRDCRRGFHWRVREKILKVLGQEPVEGDDHE